MTPTTTATGVGNKTAAFLQAFWKTSPGVWCQTAIFQPTFLKDLREVWIFFVLGWWVFSRVLLNISALLYMCIALVHWIDPHPHIHRCMVPNCRISTGFLRLA